MIDRRTLLRQSVLAVGGAITTGPLLASAGRLKERHSLVPDQTGTSYNYFNTWHSQYSLAAHHLGAKDFDAMMGDEGSRLSQIELNEKNLFGPAGLVTTCYPAVRKDLLFVLDHGWDIPPDGNLKYAGFLELDPERFPSFRGTPMQRLKGLCAAIAKGGWRGTGLWVPAQIAPIVLERDQRKGIDIAQPDYERDYWIERLRSSHEAGVAYWKVDWGKRDHDPAFREMLYALARQHAPGLVLETTVPRGPLNEVRDPRSCEGWNCEEARKDQAWIDSAHVLMKMPGAFRIYDSITFLAVPTTLLRVAGLLTGAGVAQSKAFINSEDEVYIGASLGLNMGVLRSALPGVRYVADPSPRGIAQRTTETVRALRWQRIAPPVAAADNTFIADRDYLWDSWKFSRGQTWLQAVIGKQVWQGAPARMARGMELAEMKAEGERPFVTCSRHPNGATSVATLGRMSTTGNWASPRADIVLRQCPLDKPVGAFGVFRSLSLHFGRSIGTRRILMQDLASNAPIDVTSKVTVSAGSVMIPGSLIDSISFAHRESPSDMSEPGVVVTCVDA